MTPNQALEAIEEISADAQSTDPKRDWKESYGAVCRIYQIAHWVRAPKCRKNHRGWAPRPARFDDGWPSCQP